MPCLWIAIRLKLRGANGSPSTRVDPRGEARRPAGLLGQDEVAGLGLAEVGDGQLAPLLLLDRPEPVALAFLVDDAEDELAALEQLLHRMGDPAVAALLGAGEDAVADAERASPCPCAPARAAAAPGPRLPSAPAPPRRWPLSSTSTTRSTVTLGTPPILWKARPGRGVDQPLVAHVAEQGLQRDLVVALEAERPGDLALARGLVARLDEVEDLLAGGQAGSLGFLGHRLQPRHPGLDPGSTLLHPADEQERWIRIKSGMTDDDCHGWAGGGGAWAGTRRPAPRTRPGFPSRPRRPRRRRTPNRRRGCRGSRLTLATASPRRLSGARQRVCRDATRRLCCQLAASVRRQRTT